MSNTIDKSLILSKLKRHLNFTSDTDFATFLGIKPQTLSSWHSRNTFDLELLYAKCVNVNPDFLFTGLGEPFLNLQLVSLKQIEDLAKVYLLDGDISAAAGMGDLATTSRALESYDFLLLDGLPKSKTHARILVRGDSMHPTIYDRDLVIATLIDDPLEQAIKDNYIYIVVLRSGEIIIKRLLNRFAKRKQLYLRSDNPSYQSYHIYLDEVAFCWEVKLRQTSNLSNQNLELYEQYNRLEERVSLIEHQNKQLLKLLN